MHFAMRNQYRLIEGYTKDLMSTTELATELNTYPNMVLRALKFLHVPIRTRSESLKVLVQTGRVKPLSERFPMTEERKHKIGSSVAKQYSGISDEAKKKKSEMSKAKWEAKTDAEREAFTKKSRVGIRNASINGSKMENYLHKFLLDNGYECLIHQCILENSKLEVDLFLPRHKIAIEIDGVTHVQPIHGEESLQKVMRADSEKNGILINRGISVVRAVSVRKSVSENSMLESSKKILSSIESIIASGEVKLLKVEVD